MTKMTTKFHRNLIFTSFRQINLNLNKAQVSQVNDLPFKICVTLKNDQLDIWEKDYFTQKKKKHFSIMSLSLFIVAQKKEMEQTFLNF